MTNRARIKRDGDICRAKALDPAAFHIQRTLTTTARDRVHILNTQPRGGGLGNGSKGVLIR